MNSSELQEQYNTAYQAAMEVLPKFSTMAAVISRYLGKNPPTKYGPKYWYEDDNFKIYNDAYGGYITVQYKNKDSEMVEIINSHFCHKALRRGIWETELEKLYAKASELKSKQEEEQRVVDLRSKLKNFEEVC